MKQIRFSYFLRLSINKCLSSTQSCSNEMTRNCFQYQAISIVCGAPLHNLLQVLYNKLNIKRYKPGINVSEFSRLAHFCGIELLRVDRGLGALFNRRRINPQTQWRDGEALKFQNSLPFCIVSSNLFLA